MIRVENNEYTKLNSSGLRDSSMEPYSVLMSVYAKDEPAWLQQAVQSMCAQSYLPSQFVLVEDGKLTEGLYAVIEDLSKNSEVPFDIIQIPVNGGLGPALNEGLKHCRDDLVARMDADDISLPDRCFVQVAYMMKHPECSVLSGTILEFEGNVPVDVRHCAKKVVPLTDHEIRKYAVSRNPMNHPCVMFRKSAVIGAGGYNKVPLFEDYDLWLRMLFEKNMRMANLKEPLLLMRTDDMYERRGGISYVKHMMRFRRAMYQKGYVGLWKHVCITAARAVVGLLPGGMRKKIYQRKLRNDS